MASSTKVAITGFTGKLARLITTQLLRHPHVEIHGLCRNPSKVDASLRNNPRIKLFEATSSDTPALRRALQGTSVCICCYLGDQTLMIDGQKILIDACVAENVPRYIASDYCIDFRGFEYGDLPPKDPMKHVHAYLEEVEKSEKIKGVHVLNGAFTEIVWAPFLGWTDTENAVFRYYGTGDEPIEMTTYNDTAVFTAEVALDPSANGFMNVLGDRKSVKELASLFHAAYGVVPRIERLGSLEDLRTAMRLVFDKDPQNGSAWRGLFYQYYMGNGSAVLTGGLNRGRYPALEELTSVEMFLREHARENLGRSAFF